MRLSRPTASPASSAAGPALRPAKSPGAKSRFTDISVEIIPQFSTFSLHSPILFKAANSRGLCSH